MVSFSTNATGAPDNLFFLPLLLTVSVTIMCVSSPEKLTVNDHPCCVCCGPDKPSRTFHDRFVFLYFSNSYHCENTAGKTRLKLWEDTTTNLIQLV